jgi:hypothetical protein
LPTTMSLADDLLARMKKEKEISYYLGLQVSITC